MFAALLLIESPNQADVSQALTQARDASKVWLDCAFDAAPALLANTTDRAEDLAAAAVDGCTKEQSQSQQAWLHAWRIGGMDMEKARQMHEDMRRDFIRGIAAEMVKTRARAAERRTRKPL